MAKAVVLIFFLSYVWLIFEYCGECGVVVSFSLCTASVVVGFLDEFQEVTCYKNPFCYGISPPQIDNVRNRSPFYFLSDGRTFFVFL